MPKPKVIIGLAQRIAALKEAGVPAQALIGGPEIHFKRGGSFRIYGASNRVYTFDGSAAKLARYIKKLGLKWCLIQRLPGPWEEVVAEAYKITTRDTFSGEPVPVGKGFLEGKWIPISKMKTDTEGVRKSGQRVERVLKDVVSIELVRFKGKKEYTVLTVVPAVRTAHAALRIVHDFVNEKILTKDEAIMRVSPADLTAIQVEVLDAATSDAIGKGTPVSPGVARGPFVYSPSEIAGLYAQNQDAKPILVVTMTTPEDIEALEKCSGIITRVGGPTSHAAVVARGMGIPCIVGATGLETWGGITEISMDGGTGFIFQGNVATKKRVESTYLTDILSWAKPGLRVFANVDTESAAKKAFEMGAEGIGLCRTEHQFFNAERINIMRSLLLADSEMARKVALIRLLKFQREDFIGILKAADTRKVIIRLLDAPLHEFLPREDDAKQAVANILSIPKTALDARLAEMDEVNPMLGFRGCRVGILLPELYAMQSQAIAEATCEVSADVGIMIPLVSSVRELAALKSLILDVIRRIHPEDASIGIGTMIETPRACLTADEIAHHVNFISFGTNDLTQMTWGFSRDDVGKFMEGYLDLGILRDDPFTTLDVRGVGRLVRLAIELARAVKPDISIGVCGEHGGDPKSIAAFAHLGVDYVSCAPSRFDVARLTASQLAIKEETK
jgi:pyruvate,orthophosphate dikinase